MRQRPQRWMQTIWSIGLLSMGMLVSAPTTSCATWVAEGRGGIQYQKFAWIDTTLGYATQTWGSVRDDDFAQNDRQGLFSRSQSAIGGNSIQNYHL